MKRASLCAGLAALTLALGCGHEDLDGTARDSSIAADSTTDVFVPIEDTIQFETAQPEVAADTTEPIDADNEPEGGQFGAPCSEPDDCNSGWCIDGVDGPACTRTCIEDCPDGFACKNVSGAGADPAFICVSIAVRLCQPCRDHGDCSLTAGDASGNLCIDRGDDGSFCGLNCGENGWPCPAGYTCAPIDGAPAGSGSQCVPADGGACECNGAGIALGLGTDCATTNAAGSCGGERFCEDGGLSVCDATVPALETCDGTDEDCDGQTDEGTSGVTCMIDNEHGSCPGATTCVEGAAVCEGREAVPESCNALDDDCDGQTDEDAVGCRDFYLDEDLDGSGAVAVRCLCGKDEASHYTADDDDDCDDTDTTAHPGAEEACDGVDNDCDDAVDEGPASGCESFYYDGDGDGFGTDEAQCLCAPDKAAKLTTREKGDCNDGQEAVHPGATEACNGYDDDCDQITDPIGAVNCTTFAYDGDNDGWGNLANVQCLCTASGDYTATKLDADCDDTNGQIHPDGIELCNGKDDDCDDAADEGFGDFDEDGFANCIDPDNDNDGDPNESDCKPFDPDIYSWAEEVCDTQDNDCDGTTDAEGSSGCSAFYFDGDFDGYGVMGDVKCLCAGAGKHTAILTGDCADANPTVNPAAAEVCNSLDDNCDAAADPPGTTGCTFFYVDADSDGWGVAGTAQCLCLANGQYTATRSPDCNDSAVSVNPGANDGCDGVDNDCDSQTDEGAGDFDLDGTPDCIDTDDDQDGDPDVSDCAPLDASVEHGATEVCDGRDNNCNLQSDEEGASGCQTWYFDSDNDGWGVTGNAKCLCGATGQYSTQRSGDCNDSVNTAHPTAAEVCDGVNNDCVGGIDEPGAGGCVTYYLDWDSDGYGASSFQCLCAPDFGTRYKVTNSNDCYDNNSNARPGQTGWFTSHRGDGSYDYNCVAGWERQYTTLGDCPNLCGGTDGWWTTSVPGCGGTYPWMDDCYYDPFCDPVYCCVDTSSRTQGCH